MPSSRDHSDAVTGAAVAVLDELGSRISEGAPSDEILGVAAAGAAAVIGGACAIDLLTPEQTAVLAAATGHVDPAAAEALAVPPGLPRPLPVALRTALAAPRPRFFDDDAAEALAGLGHSERREALRERRPRVGAWVPLVCRGDVLGVLTAFRDPGDAPLSEDDRRFLVRLAGMLGVALERERTAAQAALELRAIRERAEAGEERFAALAQTALDAIHIDDDDGRIVWANEAAGELFGLPREELVGQPLDRFIPERERPAFHRTWSAFLARGRDRGRYRLLRADGAIREIESNAIAGYVPGRHFAIVRDVTALERDGRRGRVFAAVADRIGPAVISVDRHGVIVGWDAGAQRLLGHRAEDVIGRPVEAIVPPDRRGELARQLLTAARGESTGPVPTERLDASGRRVTVTLQAVPLRDAEGTITGSCAILEPAAAIAAGAPAESLRRAAEVAEVGLWSVDAEGRTTGVNAHMAGLLGVGAQVLAGRPMGDFLRPAAAAVEVVPGRPLPAREVVLRRPDGPDVHVRLVSTPVRAADGTAGGALHVVSDVSRAWAETHALRDLAGHQRRLLDAAADGIVAVTPAGVVTFATPGLAGLLGRSPAAIVGMGIDDLGLDEGALARVRAQLARSAAGERSRSEVRFRGRELLVTAAPLLRPGSDEVECVVAAVTDIGRAPRTPSQERPSPSGAPEPVRSPPPAAPTGGGAEAERLAEQLQRTYRVLVGTNEALVRISDRATLFDELCRIAVEVGGLRMAWIGVADREAGVVRPVAQAGVSDGYVESLLIPLDPGDPRGQGPTGTAVLAGRSVVVADIAADASMLPWRAEALRRGYRSSATLPLRCGDEVIGNLNLYATEPGFFGADELQLLEQLVADVNLGLAALRHEEARREAELAVRTAEERYRTLFERAAEGIFISRRDGRFVTVNPAFARMFGYDSPEQLMDELTATDLYRHAADRRRLIDALDREGRATDVEVEGWRRDGAPVWVRLEVLAHRDETGQVASLQGMALDVTESRTASDRLATSEQRLQAIVDNLPALVAVSEIAEERYLLVNRAFEEAFELAPGEANGRTHADVLPGGEGTALRALARRALGARRAVTEERPLQREGEERTYLWTAFPLVGGGDVPYATCVVATDITDRKRTEEELRERVRWSDRIGRALREGRMLAAAQPIVDLRTGAAFCEELLVRLRDADDPHVLIEPADFLPAAERLGLVADIDRFMVDRAIERVQQGGRCVEVNLSAVTLGDRRVTAAIADRVARARLAPGALVFEITETAAIGEMDAATAFAEQVKALGCGLALDDFGTGYGAMTYLRRLRPDYMKIDRSFVTTMTSSEEDRTIVRTVVSIARELGMRTIAEGVEDAETLAELQEMGVDLAQGFHLGRPVPVD